MTGLSKPEEVQQSALRLMRLDVANSLLPFDRPLVDYLRGTAGLGFLLGSGSWHAPARFELSPTWTTVRSGLGLIPAGEPGEEGLELATLAASVAGTNGHVAEVGEAAEEAPPIEAGFLDGAPELDPQPGVREVHRTETAWTRWGRRGLRLPAGPRYPLRAKLTWGPVPEPAASPGRSARTFEPPPVPKVMAQPKESQAKPVAAPRPVVVPKPPARPQKTASAAPVDREARVARSPEPVAPPTVKEPPPPPPHPPPLIQTEERKPDLPAPPRPAQILDVPSFGGTPATTLTGEILRADQVEVPGVGGTVLKVGAPVALVLAGLGYYFFFHEAGEQTRPTAPAAQMQTLKLGDDTWVTVAAADSAGARHDRKLDLYAPSKSWKDYRLQVTGQIDSRAFGWVVRAQDARNYYALKLSADEDPNKPYTLLKRWIVVDGRESSYSEKRVAIPPHSGTLYKVEMEVKGNSYDLSIQGQPVDLWTDNRLKGGAVGFMNERAETGRAVSAKIRRLETDLGK